jgi:hypothetical protein
MLISATATASLAVAGLGAASALADGAPPMQRPLEVSSVAFGGGGGPVQSPTITIDGSGLGRAPLGRAAPGCADDSGDVYYFRNFYFWDDSQNWEAGVLGGCIGIVIRSWTTTQIVLQFGAPYGTGGSYLSNGDHYAIGLPGGYVYGGIVSGLS